GCPLGVWVINAPWCRSAEELQAATTTSAARKRLFILTLYTAVHSWSRRRPGDSAAQDHFDADPGASTSQALHFHPFSLLFHRTWCRRSPPASPRIMQK